VSAVVFFIAALGAVAGALGVVVLRNPFYSVLALVCHLLALAALFLLLNAQFVAAAQVVVYAGAVMVLYVFVVAYVGGEEDALPFAHGSGLKVVAAVACGGLFVELCIAFLGSALKAVDSRGGHIDPVFGTPAEIGQALLTKFLFPFEAASILLLVAAVGAVILARRRGGLDSVGQLPGSPIALTRPAYTGTMLEAGGGVTEEDREPADGARPPSLRDEPRRGGW
jgi:NADH-quinone oxidoreductase subunit J